MSPVRTKAKALLAEEMASQGLTKAEVGRRASLYPVQIDRALDPGHASTVGQLEQVARAMGKRLAFDVADA